MAVGGGLRIAGSRQARDLSVLRRWSRRAVLLLLLPGTILNALPLVMRANAFSVGYALSFPRPEPRRAGAAANWLGLEALSFTIGPRFNSGWGAGLGLTLLEHVPECWMTPFWQDHPTDLFAWLVPRLTCFRSPETPQRSLVPVYAATLSGATGPFGANIKLAVSAGWTFGVLNPEVEVFGRHVFASQWYPASNRVGFALRAGLGGWYALSGRGTRE